DRTTGRDEAGRGKRPRATGRADVGGGRVIDGTDGFGHRPPASGRAGPRGPEPGASTQASGFVRRGRPVAIRRDGSLSGSPGGQDSTGGVARRPPRSSSRGDPSYSGSFRVLTSWVAISRSLMLVSCEQRRRMANAWSSEML